MNRKALLLYLRDLRDLEFARRKIAAIYEKEEYKTRKTLEQLGTANLRGGEKTDVGSLIKVLIAAGVLGVGAYFFQWCGRIDDNFFLNMMSKLLWGICIFSVAVGIIAFIKDISATSAIKNSNNAERRRVNNNQGTIQNIQKNWKLRQIYLQKEYDKVLKLQKEYYNMNILAMQYRNLPAMPHTIPEWRQITEEQLHILKLQDIWKADRKWMLCENTYNQEKRDMKKKIILALLTGTMMMQLCGVAYAGELFDDTYDPYEITGEELEAENAAIEADREKNTGSQGTAGFTLDGYDCDYGKQGYYIVKSESGLYGLVDADGNMVLPAEYDEMEFVNFEDQILVKLKAEGKWGVYDGTGKEILPMEYDEIQEGNSRYLVTQDDRQSILESDGTLVKELSDTYTRLDGDDFLVLIDTSVDSAKSNLYDINENLLADFGNFTNHNDKELIYGLTSTHSDYFEVIDKNGETIYEQENDKNISERGYAASFLSSDRYLQIQGGLLGPTFGDNEYYLYDMISQEKNETKYIRMYYFDKDIIFCGKEDGADIYDEDGNVKSLTFESGYSDMYVDSENALIAVNYGETCRIYDSEGNRVTEDRYLLCDFQGEYAILENLDGEFGIMYKDGEMVLPFGTITSEDPGYDYEYNGEEIERFDTVGDHLYIQTSPYEGSVSVYVI